MKFFLFILFVLLILFLMEATIRLFQAILLAGSRMIKIIKNLFFFLFFAIAIAWPTEFGELLRPALSWLAPVVEFILDTLYDIFKAIQQME